MSAEEEGYVTGSLRDVCLFVRWIAE